MGDLFSASNWRGLAVQLQRFEKVSRLGLCWPWASQSAFTSFCFHVCNVQQLSPLPRVVHNCINHTRNKDVAAQIRPQHPDCKAAQQQCQGYGSTPRAVQRCLQAQQEDGADQCPWCHSWFSHRAQEARCAGQQLRALALRHYQLSSHVWHHAMQASLGRCALLP